MLGSVAGVYFANAMRKPDEEREGVDERPADSSSVRDALVIDTKSWEFYALTVVPLLTVPVLFCRRQPAGDLSVILILSLSSRVLLRRLRSKQRPEP